MEKKTEDKLKYGENFYYEFIISAIFIGTFFFGATYQKNEIFINQIFYWIAFVFGTMFVQIFVILGIKSIAHSLRKWINYMKEGKDKVLNILFVILILAFTIFLGLVGAAILGVWGKISLEAILGGY